MIKIFISVLFFTNILFANLTHFNYTKKDFDILIDLDIETNFIYDESLQELFFKYSKKHRLHNYVKNIKKSSIYIPKIKEELEKEGLPEVFLFMPMAESNFKIDAVSSSNALGLWQFMPQTAKNFKLRNDDYVDERLDFLKSTSAAAKYLHTNHDRFDKWYLSILAYNCGEGRVIEAITRAKLDRYLELFPEKKDDLKFKNYQKTIDTYLQTKKDFYKINRIYKKIKSLNVDLDVEKLLEINENYDRQYLPKESRIYLRKIIAFAMLANRDFFQDEDIFSLKHKSPISSIEVSGGLHLRSISSAINVKFNDLVEMNKHIKQQIIPIDVKNYTIYIPSKKVDIYNKNKEKIKNKSFVIHRVKSGETLSGIGSKYKIKYSIIKKYNELRSNRLSLNQKIIIPIDKNIKQTDKKNIARNKNNKIKKTYKIKSGDTLEAIAKSYKINIKKLMRDNNLKSSLIRVGDRIEIYR